MSLMKSEPNQARPYKSLTPVSRKSFSSSASLLLDSLLPNPYYRDMADVPVPAVEWLEKVEDIEFESGYDPLLFLSASIISKAIEDLLADPFIRENRRSFKMFKFLYMEREGERYDALAFLRTCVKGRNPYIIYLTEKYPDVPVIPIIKKSIKKWRWNSWLELCKMELQDV